MFSQLLPPVRETKIRQLRPGQILKNPNQPRREFDIVALSELADSIRRYGVLNPLTVRKIAAGYELIAGERRLRAARMAGLETVPCIVMETGEQDSSLIALVENLQRCDLDFFEEAEGYRRLIELYGMTQEEAAKKVGKTQAAVANKIRLLKLDGELCQRIRRHALSERHARALLRLGEEERKKALDYIIDKGLNVSQTDEYIELLLLPRETSVSKPRTITYIKDVRLFLNTVNRAVDLMRRSGIRAEYQSEPSGSDMVITITVTDCIKQKA